MFFSKLIYPVSLLAFGVLGYQIGVRQNHQSHVLTITLEDVQVSQIHPAALYVRTPAGKEQRFLMDAVDRDWADPFRRHPKAHWSVELAPSPWCFNRYIVQSAVEQSDGTGLTQSIVIR